MKAKTMPKLPNDLLRAMKEGQTLTEAQLRQLIELEAKAIGLSFDEALERARERKLPNNPIGLDLSLLIEMLTSP